MRPPRRPPPCPPSRAARPPPACARSRSRLPRGHSPKPGGLRGRALGHPALLGGRPEDPHTRPRQLRHADVGEGLTRGARPREARIQRPTVADCPADPAAGAFCHVLRRHDREPQAAQHRTGRESGDLAPRLHPADARLLRRAGRLLSGYTERADRPGAAEHPHQLQHRRELLLELQAARRDAPPRARQPAFGRAGGVTGPLREILPFLALPLVILSKTDAFVCGAAADHAAARHDALQPGGVVAIRSVQARPLHPELGTNGSASTAVPSRRQCLYLAVLLRSGTARTSR